MNDDDYDKQARGSGNETAGDVAIDFGDYVVIGTDIQIVLAGRVIAQPDE